MGQKNGVMHTTAHILFMFFPIPLSQNPVSKRTQNLTYSIRVLSTHRYRRHKCYAHSSQRIRRSTLYIRERLSKAATRHATPTIFVLCTQNFPKQDSFPRFTNTILLNIAVRRCKVWAQTLVYKHIFVLTYVSILLKMYVLDFYTY